MSPLYGLICGLVGALIGWRVTQAWYTRPPTPQDAGDARSPDDVMGW